jgi:hypothetical protein
MRLDRTRYRDDPEMGVGLRPGTEEAKDDALAVERRADGRLWAVRGGEAVPVRLVRCFPWTAPGQHLSLRDDDDREVAFVADLAEALHTAGFVLEVTAIEALEEDFEVRRWTVRTRQGRRQFQTALDAWPREDSDGGLLVEDVAGDLFRVPPAAQLDPRSRKLAWAFFD